MAHFEYITMVISFVTAFAVSQILAGWSRQYFHREAILLVSVNGLGYDEAAEVLGVPTGTIRSRMKRGRTLLQKALWTQAREAGLPGAIVPGIMSQGILVGLIHAWAPNAEVQFVDTIFRSPLLVDSKATASGVVTDIDDDTKIIEIDLTLTNEKGETPVVGTARVTL